MNDVITRTEAVYKMIGSKGRFFGVRYANGSGKETSVNGQFTDKENITRNVNKIMGHTEVHDVHKGRTKSGKKARKRVNNRRIMQLNIDNCQFKVRD